MHGHPPDKLVARDSEGIIIIIAIFTFRHTWHRQHLDHPCERSL
jgi:hypothetical protein